jgi:DNA-binding transcriptional LysR family regulator
MARHAVPGLVRRMSRRSPHVELHLRESDCDLELQRQVACGDLDIAFVVTPVSEDWLTTLELMEDGPVAVVCDGDPYADCKTLDIRDLRARNIATFAISPYQSALEHALQADGSRPRITVRTEDNDVLIAIARSGDSLALMTDLSARGFLVDGVRAVPVRAAPARGIALAWNARATRRSGWQRWSRKRSACARRLSANPSSAERSARLIDDADSGLSQVRVSNTIRAYG